MQYDALIIGGGPAGSVTALLLARAGFSVCLVEKKDFPRRKVCGEFLSAASAALLQKVGVYDAWAEIAGPPVKRIGLFAGDEVVLSPVRRAAIEPVGWGRALDRAALDRLLLDAARGVGVDVMQPADATAIRREGPRSICTVQSGERTQEVESAIVIAAHGSWETGSLASQPAKSHQSADLLAFKAHLRDSDLREGLMPLLAFPGGYGGMVHTDGDRVSLSCCIRRDTLQTARHRFRVSRASEALICHLQTHCRGFRDATVRAHADDAWLAAGPIRPGIRPAHADGIFRVGNAAGEAHPVVAEGISMAIQSGFLLARRLTELGPDGLDEAALAQAGRAYSRDWRNHFAARIHFSSLIAHLAMRPAQARTAAFVVKRLPAMLTLGARASGKT